MLLALKGLIYPPFGTLHSYRVFPEANAAQSSTIVNMPQGYLGIISHRMSMLAGLASSLPLSNFFTKSSPARIRREKESTFDAPPIASKILFPLLPWAICIACNSSYWWHQPLHDNPQNITSYGKGALTLNLSSLSASFRKVFKSDLL